MKRRLLVAGRCPAGALPEVLAKAARVVEASELPGEADLQRAHDDLTLTLWAARERQRISEEMRRDGQRPLANAIRRSGGSAAMN